MIYKLPVYFEIADTNPDMVQQFIEGPLRKEVESSLQEHMEEQVTAIWVKQYNDIGIHACKLITKKSVVRKFVQQNKKNK